MSLSPDPTFNFKLLRWIGTAAYRGAGIAETLDLADRLRPGDFESWHSESHTLAERVASEGSDESTSSATRRDRAFRAASYYRAADGFTAPAILYRAGRDGTPRPTILTSNGFDGSQEEMLHLCGLAALERGRCWTTGTPTASTPRSGAPWPTTGPCAGTPLDFRCGDCRTGRENGERPMIYHSTRMTFKPGVPPEKREEVLESLRNQGRVIPSVKTFIVGHDIGGEYEYAATYAIEDLDGYWEYLIHPAHHHTDLIGLPVGDKFVSYDVVDEDDPDMAAKIAALHQRRYDNDPELTGLVSDLASYQGSAAPGPHSNR